MLLAAAEISNRIGIGNSHLSSPVAEFSALLAEIKKDPKKYLNVKVSIF